MQPTPEPQTSPATEGMAVDSDVDTQVEAQVQQIFNTMHDAETYETLENGAADGSGASTSTDLLAECRVYAEEFPQASGSPAEYTQLRTDPVQTDHTSMQGMQETNRSLAQEMDAEGAAMEVEKQPTLLEKALLAMSKKKARKQLSQGDVMLLLDEYDLRKTVRLNSKSLRHQLPSDSHLLRLIMGATRVPGSSINGVGVLALLRYSAMAEFPTLQLQALDIAAPAVAYVRSDTSQTTDDAETNVKGEPGEEDRQAAVVPESGIDWLKAYDSLIRIIVFLPNISAQRCRIQLKAEAALPILQGIVAITEYYDCLQLVRSAFMSIASEWISGRSLYPAIAANPHDWLILAVKLQSKLVYYEAFVHMAGLYPNVELRGLSHEVHSLIAAESLALHYKRQDVDQQLLMSTLGKTSRQGNGELIASDTVIKPVSQHSHPILWTLVNLWRDYITEHLAHIKAGSSDSAEVTPTCEHPSGRNNDDDDDAATPECLTVAGFYRTLHRGGDAYMAFEDVLASWKGAGAKEQRVEAELRTHVKMLKARGVDIVAPLVRSSLQLEGRGRLRYLSCGEVGGLPWVEEGEEGEGMDVD
ncbi:hypothetical protein B0A55_05945 [Friedmanniomyces simplex]|uniref:Uncharacterized protein n=1 Tax=Friedmanniomyces simplex TaxID=329884 RepID=A0A4U0XA03_9PEZI|nr:hypothetical protein B0A55_05945 [Friedmanniomyces simplex]